MKAKIKKAAAPKAAKTTKPARPAKAPAAGAPAAGAKVTKVPATKPASGTDKVLLAFDAREGTNQAKALARLAATMGKPVKVDELVKFIYGADGSRTAVAMVLGGIAKKIKTGKLAFHLTKDGKADTATVTLAAGGAK